MLDGGHHAGGRFQRLVAAFAPHLRHGEQDAAKAGAAIAVVARKIRPAKVGPAIGSEKRRERPSALPADGRNRGLVARVHVGPLVAIDFHGDKVLVDDASHLRVFVGFAVHHMAPVAPHRANVQQDGLVFSLGAGKRSLAPRVPLHRLMARRAQVGRGGVSPVDWLAPHVSGRFGACAENTLGAIRSCHVAAWLGYDIEQRCRHAICVPLCIETNAAISTNAMQLHSQLDVANCWFYYPAVEKTRSPTATARAVMKESSMIGQNRWTSGLRALKR